MALKTCSAAVKKAFASIGITLTPTQEHLAASVTSIDWLKLIADLGAAAKVLIPIILALFGIAVPPPTPTPGMQAQHGCDHYACACAVLASALETASLAAEHCCQCCEGGYGS